MTKNVAFVYGLQISNYLLSFITLPYLTRVLDVQGYGALSYCSSANAYLWMLMEWGFGVGALRQVAMVQNDARALREVFWSTLNGKLLLIAPAAVLLFALAHIGNAIDPQVVAISGALTIAGAALSCDWFVQGVERMGVYLFISVAARIFTTALTVLLVRDPSDVMIAAVIHGSGALLAGVGGFVFVWLAYRMKRPELSLRVGAQRLWEFRHYFIARSNNLLYASAAPVILGIVSTTAALGLFATAEKTTRVFILLLGPLSIALAPRINALMIKSRDDASKLSARVIVLQVMLTVPASIFLLLFADLISKVVLGPNFADAATVIRILSPMPTLVGVSAVLASQFLVPLGRARALSRVTIVSGAAYVAGLFVFGRMAGASGAAVTYVLAEFLLLAGFIGILLLKERAYLSAAWKSLFAVPGQPS